MKTSTIKSVQTDGTWNGKDGTLFYRFTYEMQDGIVIQASHKAPENALAVGDDCEYEIKRTHETYGNSGTVQKPKPAYGGKDLLGIKIGHALNCASVLLAPQWVGLGSDEKLSLIKGTAMMIYKISEELNNELS